MSTNNDTPGQARADAKLIQTYYRPNVFRQFFTTPFQQYAERVGEPFEVIGRDELAESKLDDFEYMYRIRFADGCEITAWGHEVCVLTNANRGQS